MTTPPTPPPDMVNSLLAWSHKERDAVELELKKVHLSYRLVGIFLAVLLVIGGFEAWKWHVRKLARLEAAATVAAAKATSEHAAAESWRVVAAQRTAMVRVDTVTIARIVYRTPTFTAPIPVTAPDGSVSEIPMPVVLRADFDSLGGSCNRLARDCASALAAKDSAAVHDSLVIATLYELNHNTEQRLKMSNHAKLFAKIIYGAAGASGGYVLGRASCPR